MKLIQIAPQLAPSINGVGDHARLLAGQLRQDFGIETHFVVGDPSWEGPDVVEGFPVARVGARSAQALVAALESTRAETLLLHYVGYGYATRGCPIWLVDGISQWLRRDSSRRLITFFHELFASGPPWTSSFWLSRLQRHLVVRLSLLSASVATNRSAYAGFIASVRAQQQSAIPVLPVFSNVGEPETVPSLMNRRRQMVVFGGPSKRARIYRSYSAELASAYRHLKLEQILDIGPAFNPLIHEIDGIPVRQLGALQAEEISQTLLRSMAGFIALPPEALAKSGIFAAYCAHGVLSITPLYNCDQQDGLVSGQHYISLAAPGSSTSLESHTDIAGAAVNWYRSHNLQRQSCIFTRLLSGE